MAADKKKVDGIVAGVATPVGLSEEDNLVIGRVELPPVTSSVPEAGRYIPPPQPAQDALDTLALICAYVARGNSTEKLRNMTRQLYPKTAAEGKQFQEILDRFRLAANAMHGYGNEEFVGLLQNQR